MKVQAADLSPETFTPTWRENRDQPEDEQIKVTVHFPTVEEFEPFARANIADLDGPAVVAKFCRKIENLEIAGKAIENGEQLIQQRRNVVSDLVVEILFYIWRGATIDAVQEKN